jgi:23S rRNA G2069 N7-methylase RlmK/C1962 C5-methylase RlmI
VDPEPFAEMVRAAGRECRRTLSVLRTLTAGPDHPVDLSAPEGRYLTGLLLTVRA